MSLKIKYTLTLTTIIQLLQIHASEQSNPQNFTAEATESVNQTAHLSLKKVQEFCAAKERVCKDGVKSMVCAVRVLGEKWQYKEFESPCDLFMSNMCEYPGRNYYIITAGNCEPHINARRHSPGDIYSNIANGNNTFLVPPNTKPMLITDQNGVRLYSPGKMILRQTNVTEPTPQRTTYAVIDSYDFHDCPYHCTNVYEPECVVINKNEGKYLRMLFFMNHCLSDLYYCKYSDVFSPPPGKPENARKSPVSWSFCAANPFIMFSRFSEVASSMSHYGWLHGDYPYTAILRPEQRAP